MLRSENARLNGWVYIDIRGRDIGSFVTEAKAEVGKQLVLPAGYALTWSGQYEYMERAKARLAYVVPLTVAIIVLLLYLAFRRFQEVLLILKEALRHKQLPSVPVFIDGMVRAVCGVYARHERYVSRALERELRVAGNPFFTQGMQPVRSPEDRRAVLQAGACVIVSS